MWSIDTTTRQWVQVCCTADGQAGADDAVAGLSSELSRSRGQDCEVKASACQVPRMRTPILVTGVAHGRQCAYSTHLERNLQLKFAPLRQHLCISIFEHHPWDQKGCRACKACPAFVALKVLEVLKQRQNLKGSHSADVEWLEAFAASIKSEGVISSVPKLLYIDAVLPNSTGMLFLWQQFSHAIDMQAGIYDAAQTF